MGHSRLIALIVACGLIAVTGAQAQDDYSSVVLADEPVAYYRFEEEAGEEFVEDSSGEGHDSLSMTNANLGVDGFVGGAVEFFGDGSIELDLQVNPADSEDDGVGSGLDDFSIEVFLKPTELTPADVFVSQMDGFGTGRSVLLITAGTAELGSFLGGGNSRSTVVAQVDTWYHYVMTYDGGALDGETLRFYVDGELAGTGTRVPESADGNWVVGSHKSRGSQFFAGVLDELSFYDYRLDDPDGDDDTADSRVLSHFEASSAGIGPVDERPVFHRGDTGTDGTINITDAVGLLNFLFSGGEESTCKETQDFNNDGSIVITDAVSILSFLFSSGPAPAPPGPPMEPCGRDPDAVGSVGDLGCEAYDSC